MDAEQTIRESAPVRPDVGTLLADALRARTFRQGAVRLPSWDLASQKLADVGLVLNGGFAPLRGVMREAEYETVIADVRLGGGSRLPIPINLDTRA